MVDEAARHALYRSLEAAIGAEATSTMMTLLPPVGWAEVATKDDLRQLEARLDQRIDALGSRLDGRIDALGSRLDGRIDALEARMDGRIDALAARLEGQIGGLEGRMEQRMADLETRFTAAMRTQLFALLGAMFSISALTVAASAVLG